MKTHLFEDKPYRVIWPEPERNVSARTLIEWACDDVDNGEHPGPKPTNVQEAIDILNDTGSVTLGQASRNPEHRRL